MGRQLAKMFYILSLMYLSFIIVKSNVTYQKMKNAGATPLLMDIGPPCAPWYTMQFSGAQWRSHKPTHRHMNGSVSITSTALLSTNALSG